MKFLIGLFFAVIVLGGSSGKEIHEAAAGVDLAQATQNIALVMLASAGAMFVVVGAQVLRKEPRYGRR
jgi:hypothetical protein